MVEPAKRTRSKKKVKKKVPGGGNVTHFRGKKHSKPTCARRHTTLSGIPKDAPSKLKKLTKSQRQPARPYAKVLCTKCLDELVRYVCRQEAKASADGLGFEVSRDLTLEKYLSRGWYKGVTEGKVTGFGKKREKPKGKAAASKPKPKKKAKSKAKTKKKK